MIFHQSFKILEPVKHTKFNLHDVNECFLLKNINEVILCFALPWNVIVMGPHRYLHTSSNKKIAWKLNSKEMGSSGVYIHTPKKTSSHDFQKNLGFQQSYLCPWL
jgi:hypothetical protein